MHEDVTAMDVTVWMETDIHGLWTRGFHTFSKGNWVFPIEARVSLYAPIRAKLLVRTALGPPGLATTATTYIMLNNDKWHRGKVLNTWKKEGAKRHGHTPRHLSVIRNPATGCKCVSAGSYKKVPHYWHLVRISCQKNLQKYIDLKTLVMCTHSGSIWLICFFQTCIIAKHLYLVLLRYNFPHKSCHTVTKDVTWKSIEMFLLFKTAQMNRIHSVRTTDHWFIQYVYLT